MACGNWDTADDAEKIEILKCLTEELDDKIKHLNKSASEFTGTLGSSNSVLKDMKDTVLGMTSSILEFTTSFQQQYQLGERIAQAYKKTGLEIGISVGRSKQLNQEFKGAVASVAKWGGTMEDVQQIYSNFADTSGRARVLREEDVDNIFKLSQAADLVGSEATNLYEVLDLMGVSNEAATQRMNDLIKDSQKIGLNSSKVVKVLANNMKSMQTYSFASGVKGMTEMAKLGVKLRMDVSSMLGMAEKFYQPEAAIEAAANLQMLGGDIAEAFGDPFETMYLARNKPEELAERLQGMTENMMTFNEETGEYEFPAEVRMQLKAAGEQLGINTDQMIEMARQTSKMKDVKDQLSMTSSFDEDEMDAIASMARMEDGQFKVDVRNDKGEILAKSLDELTSKDLEMMVTPPKDEKDYMTEMIYNSKTTNEHLANIEDAAKKGFIADVVDVYSITEEMTKEGIAATEHLIGSLGNAMVESIDDYITDLFPKKDQLKSLEQYAQETGTKIADAIRGFEEIVIQDGKINVTNMDDILKDLDNLKSGKGKGHVVTDGADGDHIVTGDALSMPGGGDRFITGGYGEIFKIDSRDTVAVGPYEGIFGGKNTNNNIKIDPMTITINGDLSVNMPDGATERVNMEFIKPQIVKLIKSHLNGMAYNGTKPAGNADGADMVLNS